MQDFDVLQYGVQDEGVTLSSSLRCLFERRRLRVQAVAAGPRLDRMVDLLRYRQPLIAAGGHLSSRSLQIEVQLLSLRRQSHGRLQALPISRRSEWPRCLSLD